MPNYAGIGSRRLSLSELQLCKDIGSFLAKKGWTLHTGAAKGADQAFTEGALEQNGSVVLYLPWATYEQAWTSWAKSRGASVVILQDSNKEAYDSISLFHPAAEKLTRGPRALHARNYLIIQNCSLVVAFPKLNKWGQKGGTEQGLRIARHLGIKIRDLSEEEDYEKVVNKIYMDIPKQTRKEQWYQLTIMKWRGACGAIKTENGVITETAPIFKKLKGVRVSRLPKDYKLVPII